MSIEVIVVRMIQKTPAPSPNGDFNPTLTTLIIISHALSSELGELIEKIDDFT